MAEFLILPQRFLDYVAAFKRIPLAPGPHLDSLRSEIELVCLEAAMGLDQPEVPPQPSDRAPDAC